VSARDRIDDRQPETGAPALARFVRAGESLEGARKEVRREPVPSSRTWISTRPSSSAPVILTVPDERCQTPEVSDTGEELEHELVEALRLLEMDHVRDARELDDLGAGH
jgi:hypothetical protein